MNSFLKAFLVIAVALPLLALPVSASKNLFFSISSDNDSLFACKGPPCYIAAMPFVKDYLLWYHSHNRIKYNYKPQVKYDIYGEPVYNYPNYIYANQFFGFPTSSFYYTPPKIFPPASVRNTQAELDTMKKESEFLIRIKNNQQIESTSTVVPESTSSAIITPQTSSWHQVVPTQTFLSQSNKNSNTLIFSPKKSDISCNTLGFVFDTIDVKANESITKSLYIKNTAGEDFFVDSVVVKENEDEFNAFGNVFDEKILQNDQARISVTVDAFDVQNDIVEDIEVKVMGHFESGKMCTLEKEFFVGVKGQQKLLMPQRFIFSAPLQIEFEENGFVEISLENLSVKDLKITITPSKSAIIFPNIITVPKNNFVQRVISINQASNEEFIYYGISVDGQLVEQLFSKVVFPKKEEKAPQTHVLEEENGQVRISSYSSKVMFVKNVANIPIVLENTSDTSKEVVVELVNLPKGVKFNPVTLTIGPSQTRPFSLDAVDFGANEFPFSAILATSFDGQTTSRQIVFEKEKKEVPMQEQAPTTEPQSPDFISTGLVALQENVLAVGVAVLIFITLIAIMLFLIQKSGSNKEPWTFKNSS